VVQVPLSQLFGDSHCAYIWEAEKEGRGGVDGIWQKGVFEAKDQGFIRNWLPKTGYDGIRYNRYRNLFESGKKEGKCMAETSEGILEAKEKSFIQNWLLKKIQPNWVK
jgi:hypothetical protein